ncbi:hypothetical protein EG68_00656 [Paragonimus skrjabini miyazakii]|uniref:Uncharacterized protein n=1 Tax=Paragonimus skrjabini miyazakii TaxID=59628 RepID=A0A8S9Z5A0_9TREM|nr:hypothetical protein EG68_00656 [Paragonimus skrjabini miyazakii]
MLRVVCKQLDEEGLEKNMIPFEFFESSSRNKSEMVIYEAARAFINLRGPTAGDLAPAISVLQVLCSSPKPSSRYISEHSEHSSDKLPSCGDCLQS